MKDPEDDDIEDDEEAVSEETASSISDVLSPVPPPSGSRMLSLSYKESHTGPLPSPRTLAGYEKVLPGAAERILRQLEIQGDHRRSIEAAQSASVIAEEDANSRRMDRGQVFGLIIVLVAFTMAGAGFVMGYPSEAAWLVGTTVVTLAAIFVLGRYFQGKQDIDPPSV